MNRIIQGDCLEVLKKMGGGSVQTCITSPPYWGLRDYGVDGQLGLEDTPEDFVAKMVAVFREVRRILKDDGTLWLNIGDSYASVAKNRTEAQANSNSTLGGTLKTQSAALVQKSKVVDGLKKKDLVGIPWMLAFALRTDGWYLRQDIIWHKPNPMPESVQDRCTKAHEYLFLLTKSEKYLYNVDAIREPTVKGWAGSQFHTGKTAVHQQGRASANRSGTFHDHKNDLVVGQRIKNKQDHPLGKNKRSVWTVSSTPFKEAHFATFPPKLIEPCVLAGSRPGDIVLDPFFGAGTTGLVAQNHGRNYIGVELNPEYIKIAEKRLSGSLFGYANQKEAANEIITHDTNPSF